MRVTKRKLMALTGALILCICATLALKYVGLEAEAEAEQAKTYFFSGYASVDELVAMSIENASGEVVLAHYGDQNYVAPENGLSPAGETITELFGLSYQLPLNGLLEGASSADPQFGLTAPTAVVTLQDVHDGGLVFYLGNATPDGTGVYACLSGDDRVFTMARDYADWFLRDVSVFYDMSLVRAESLTAVELYRDSAGVFALEQKAAVSQGGTSQYALTDPFRLPVDRDRVETVLLSPLETLAGVSMVGSGLDDAVCGITEASPRVYLRYADGSSDCLKVGGETAQGTLVTAENSGMTFLVPTTALAFVYAEAADLVGTTLLQLNINQFDSVEVNGCIYTVSGDNTTLQIARNGVPMEVAQFQEQVLAPLNGISIYGASGDVVGELLLTVRMQTRFDKTPLELRFYETDGRSCTVAVDGKPVFLCGKTSVEALVKAAG